MKIKYGSYRLQSRARRLHTGGYPKARLVHGGHVNAQTSVLAKKDEGGSVLGVGARVSYSHDVHDLGLGRHDLDLLQEIMFLRQSRKKEKPEGK